MSEFFGPLDSDECVPPRQQTRVAAFLISAHGALARQFAFALPVKLESAWQTELNAQFYRESEIVSLLLRATTWVPDLTVGPDSGSEIAAALQTWLQDHQPPTPGAHWQLRLAVLSPRAGEPPLVTFDQLVFPISAGEEPVTVGG